MFTTGLADTLRLTLGDAQRVTGVAWPCQDRLYRPDLNVRIYLPILYSVLLSILTLIDSIEARVADTVIYHSQDMASVEKVRDASHAGSWYVDSKTQQCAAG